MNITVLLGSAAMLFFWGVWGVFVKLVTKEIGMQALLWGQLRAIGLFPLYFFLFKEMLPLELKAGTIALSVVAGMLGVLGTMTEDSPPQASTSLVRADKAGFPDVSTERQQGLTHKLIWYII